MPLITDDFTKLSAYILQKATWMGNPVRLKFTCEGLLITDADSLKLVYAIISAN